MASHLFQNQDFIIECKVFRDGKVIDLTAATDLSVHILKPSGATDDIDCIVTNGPEGLCEVIDTITADEFGSWRYRLSGADSQGQTISGEIPGDFIHKAF